MNPTEDALIGRIDASRRRLRACSAPLADAKQVGNVAPAAEPEDAGTFSRPRIVVVTWDVRRRGQ